MLYMLRMFAELRSFITNKAVNSQRSYKHIFNDWLAFLKSEESLSGEKRFASASAYDAMRYVEAVGKRAGIKNRYGGDNKTAPATIAHRIHVLRTFYDVLIRSSLLNENPFMHPAFDSTLKHRSQKRPTELVPFEYVKRFMAAPSSVTKEGIRDRGIFAMLFGGALRVSEVRNLRIADVRMDRTTVRLRLRNTKNGTDAVQTVPNWANHAIRQLKRQRARESSSETEFLVTEYFSLLQRSTARQIGAKQIYRIFRTWAKHLGLSHVSPHSARATAITKLLDMGISHRDVAKFSRHASISAVERYDKRRNAESEKVAARLKY